MSLPQHMGKDFIMIANFSLRLAIYGNTMEHWQSIKSIRSFYLIRRLYELASKDLIKWDF